MKAQTIVSERQVKLWSHRCVESHWKFGLYIANLPPERWVQRALHWKPAGARVAGQIERAMVEISTPATQPLATLSD
jgi:hypothetical protein